METIIVFLLLLLGVLTVPQQNTTDVPPAVVSQYRGGSARPGVIEADPFREAPALMWNFPLARPTRMTPAVYDDAVYIGSEAGILYALDRASGGERWLFDAGASLVSTPAVTAERLYVGALNGIVYALDRETGAVVWTAELGGQVFASPLLADDVVTIGSTNGTVAALAADDGSIVWEYAAGDAVWSSAALAGSTVVVGTRGGQVLTLDAATGVLTAEFAAAGPIDATPAIIGSGSASGVVVGDYTGLVSALDTADITRVLWQRQLDGAIYASAAVTTEAVYTLTHSGQVAALAVADGAPLWTAEVGGPAYASPVVVGDVVYIVTENDALLIAFDRMTGERLWEVVTGYEGDWRVSAPVIVGDQMLIGSNEPGSGLLAFMRGSR